jgi:hypothetical protein
MSNNSKATKETIGLWRYGIIFPLLKKNFKPGEKIAIIKDISSKEYDIPGTTRTRIGKTTVYDWLNHYLQVGSVEGLYPKNRIDAGESRKINTEDQLALIHFRQREDNKGIPITTLVEKAQGEKVIDPNTTIKMNTVYRLMKNNNLENLSEESQADRRRFEASAPNEIWQMDFMHAVNVKVEEKGKTIIKKAKIGVLIDDYSRLAMAKAYVYETDESLMDLMWDSFNQRGLPKIVYTDNGSAMKSKRISLGCTALQIILKFSNLEHLLSYFTSCDLFLNCSLILISSSISWL